MPKLPSITCFKTKCGDRGQVESHNKLVTGVLVCRVLNVSHEHVDVNDATALQVFKMWIEIASTILLIASK